MHFDLVWQQIYLTFRSYIYHQSGPRHFIWPISGQCSHFIPPENIRKLKGLRKTGFKKIIFAHSWILSSIWYSCNVFLHFNRLRFSITITSVLNSKLDSSKFQLGWYRGCKEDNKIGNLSQLTGIITSLQIESYFYLQRLSFLQKNEKTTITTSNITTKWEDKMKQKLIKTIKQILKAEHTTNYTKTNKNWKGKK